MKKKTFILLVIITMCSSTVIAQTWGEWFRQKKTQRKYLIEQIAAIQVYLDYVKKGYNIAKDGTNLVGDIKNGDFNLHNEYFNSMKSVNPLIRNSDQPNDIIKMNDAMMRSRIATMKLVDKSKVFDTSEIKAIKQLYASLANEATKDLDELKLLIGDGKLELSDDERIERIGKLYKRMQEKYGFQMQMDTKIKNLSESRISDLKGLEALKKLYGL